MAQFRWKNYMEMKPISKATLESVRKNTAKYIYVLNKQDGTIKCEKCGCTTTLLGSKHKSLINCPICHSQMEVCHIWRRSWTEDIAWNVKAEVIDNDNLALRYILCFRINGKVMELEERAREIIDFKNLVVRNYENPLGKGWKPHHVYNYFREYSMGYSENRWCCLGATPTSSFWNTVFKMDRFKYFDPRAYMHKGKTYYASGTLAFMGKYSALFEKFEKVGLSKLVDDALNSYTFRNEYAEFDRNETELTKMLGINKAGLKYIKANPYWETVRLVRKYPNTLESVIDMQNLHVSEWQYGKILEQPNSRKLINYLLNNDIRYSDYSDYLKDLNVLGYQLDNSYRYPKNFHQWHLEVANRVVEKNLKDEEIKNASQSTKIKAIKEALNQYKDLKELLGGSKGFLVYVPESASDLKREGMMLHNCIGTYVDRVADNKTLLFFIRRLNDPNAPFVAMEYAHGHIVQIRYDHNEDVTTSNKKDSAEIVEFAEAIAHTLRKHNILVA